MAKLKWELETNKQKPWINLITKKFNHPNRPLCFQNPLLSSKALLKIKTFSPLMFLIQWETEEILISGMIIGSKILYFVTFSLDYSLRENFQKLFPPSYALQKYSQLEHWSYPFSYSSPYWPKNSQHPSSFNLTWY